jgi:hypothetical protein
MNVLTSSLSESVGIVGSCINCAAPANLLATFAVILVGVGLAVHYERRKPTMARI